MEKNNQLQKQPKVTISTTIEYTLHQKAKEFGLSWNKALTIGIINGLLEQGALDIIEVPQDFYFSKQMNKLKIEKVDLMKEITELKEKIEEDTKQDPKEIETETKADIENILETKQQEE